MNKIGRGCGRVLFWLTWPALGSYLRRTKRTRVVVISGDALLLTKGWISDGRWLLPGGGRHRGESAAASIRRELCEETGLELPIEAFEPQGSVSYQKHGFRFSDDFFIATIDERPPLRPQPYEIIAVAWVKIDESMTRECGADVLAGLALAGVSGDSRDA